VTGSQVPNHISVYSLDTNFQRIISSWEKENSSVSYLQDKVEVQMIKWII